MDKRKYDHIKNSAYSGAIGTWQVAAGGRVPLSKRDLGALEEAWQRSRHYPDIQLDEKRIKEQLAELQEMMKRIDHETAKTERALALDVWFPYAAETH